MIRATRGSAGAGVYRSGRRLGGRLAAGLLANLALAGVLFLSAGPLRGQAVDPLDRLLFREGGPRVLPGVVANDNLTPAGELRDGILTVRLEARKGIWHPQGEDGPALEIEAFGEEGGALQSPGPLIRVPVGTEVRVSLHNLLDRPLLTRGLSDRDSSSRGPVEIHAGETRALRFRATTPGTYYYWGRTSDDRAGLGVFEDGQLAGALVVDPPGTRPDDRILVIALWVNRDDVEPLREEGVRHTFLVNGLSWPYTERLAAVVGDSVRLRVINATVAPHPMHLHGFYYSVDARGDAWRDTVYSARQRRLGVTELMRPGTTMSLGWLPKRPGHWLFHCHFIAHISPEQHLREAAGIEATLAHLEHPGPDPGDHRAAHRSAFAGMAGLMTGILVSDPAGKGLREDETARRRRLRLYANARDGYFGEDPAFSYVLQEGPEPPATDSIRIPGTPIFLTRNEPVEVTVINRIAHPISVHWHGIELDSYYDGVPGWSGLGDRIAPLIAPGDSFVVRFTPNRAGTFIYHTHAEEAEQLSSGLYGPLIVLEPGQVHDPETDRIFLLGWGGPGPEAPPYLNGSAEPPPVELTAGRAHRLRFINITPSNNQMVRLLSGDRVAEWRRVGKDGAGVSNDQAIVGPAEQFLGAGETYDFELTPATAGQLSLEVTTFMRGGRPPVVMKVPVRVR
ncbi:MAG: multicopper oxidase domain-containing protein [Gemmatimonadota bacterium]